MKSSSAREKKGGLARQLGQLFSGGGKDQSARPNGKGQGKTRKTKSPPDSYVDELVHTLNGIKFKQVREAARALGETSSSVAVEALLAMVRNCGSLRAAGVASLKKISEESEAAAVELTMALMDDRRDAQGAEYGVRVLSQGDRRNSPPVLLEVPVMVKWRAASGEAYSEPSIARIVNAFGALLLLGQPVPPGTELHLTNVKTGSAATARVAWGGSLGDDGKQEVGIELGETGARFWVGKSPKRKFDPDGGTKP